MGATDTLAKSAEKTQWNPILSENISCSPAFVKVLPTCCYSCRLYMADVVKFWIRFWKTKELPLLFCLVFVISWKCDMMPRRQKGKKIYRNQGHWHLFSLQYLGEVMLLDLGWPLICAGRSCHLFNSSEVKYNPYLSFSHLNTIPPWMFFFLPRLGTTFFSRACFFFCSSQFTCKSLAYVLWTPA